MRILVIGGTGLTGPHIVRRLHELGHAVTLFNRGRTEAGPAAAGGSAADGSAAGGSPAGKSSPGLELPAGIRRLTGDRRTLTDHAEELRKLAPDVVLDMALVTAQDAWSAMCLFRGAARRIVAISSQDVYRAYGRLIRTEPGPSDPVPLAETAPLREKLYPYRARVPGPDDLLFHYDKIPVERLVLSEPELPGTILRYPMVFGPRDRQHRLFPYLKRMDDGRTAILLEEGQARWRTTRGFAEDMAGAVVLAVTDERAAGRVYNVGESEALSESAWVERIGRAVGWSGRIVTLPAARLPKHLDEEIDAAQDLVCDTARIRAELGYRERVAPEDAMRRTVAWEREHPPEKIDPASFDYAAEDAAIGSA